LGLPYERNCPKNIDKCGIFIVLERFLLPVELALEGFPSRAANTMKLHKTNQGFTLTEFLVAMAVSGIVMTAIYSTLRSQQKTTKNLYQTGTDRGYAARVKGGHVSHGKGNQNGRI
jgi:prepilin-type N-terminal cleavage/methylation domain-containing protein